MTVGVVLCVLSSRSHSVNQTKRKFGQLVFVNFQQTLFLFDLWILKVCPSFLSRQEINFYVQYKTVECRGSNEWVYKRKSIISGPVRCSEIISRKTHIFCFIYLFKHLLIKLNKTKYCHSQIYNLTADLTYYIIIWGQKSAGLLSQRESTFNVDV